jgi:thioester reductase-like protein
VIEMHPVAKCSVADPFSLQVLTGATGSLGAHLLDQLLNQKDVERVICLARAKNDEDALKRVEESLQVRSLPSLSQRGGDKAVVAYPSDLSLPDL